MNIELQKITFSSRDEYQRKAIAEKIITLLSSGIPISPLIINGGWGTGKTEFCHKLINLITETAQGYTPIYVDAFAADHADEPLMTLLAAVLKALPEEKRGGLIEKALPAIRFGLKASLKAGVSWVLRQDFEKVADDFDKDIQNVSDEAINKSIESLLADHVKAEESIGTLRQSLLELTKEQHIILFVDELDRCRPDFAISMLESIKHVFGVEGVQIVLVTNIDQLKSSISHCYGMDDEGAKRYLDKFVGFALTLPSSYQAPSNEFNGISGKHFVDLIAVNETLKAFNWQNGFIDTYCIELVERNSLSLREVETFVKYLSIYQVLAASNKVQPLGADSRTMLRILGVYLACFHQNLILNKTENSVDRLEILKAFRFESFSGKDEYYDPSNLELVFASITYDYPQAQFIYEKMEDKVKEALMRTVGQYFSSRATATNFLKLIVDSANSLRLGHTK